MTEWATPLVGACCLVSSFCVGIHQILLSPAAVNYPKARPLTRAAMFLVCGFFLIRGADLLIGCAEGSPQHIATSALPASIGVAAYFAIKLWDVLHQRLPAYFHERMARAFELATCDTWGARAWAWIMGRDTLSGARRRASRDGDGLSPKQAALLLGEAALSGDRLAIGPGEKIRRPGQ